MMTHDEIPEGTLAFDLARMRAAMTEAGIAFARRLGWLGDLVMRPTVAPAAYREVVHPAWLSAVPYEPPTVTPAPATRCGPTGGDRAFGWVCDPAQCDRRDTCPLAGVADDGHPSGLSVDQVLDGVTMHVEDDWTYRAGYGWVRRG
jgi:hypothetical protein